MTVCTFNPVRSDNDCQCDECVGRPIGKQSMTDSQLNDWMGELAATGADVSLGNCPEGWCLTIVDWDHEGNQDEYDYVGATPREAIERAVSSTRQVTP